MTNKKQDDDFNADMWLHVASDCLARYALEDDGGVVRVRDADDGIHIVLEGVHFDNELLHVRFVGFAAASG